MYFLLSPIHDALIEDVSSSIFIVLQMVATREADMYTTKT